MASVNLSLGYTLDTLQKTIAMRYGVPLDAVRGLVSVIDSTHASIPDNWPFDSDAQTIYTELRNGEREFVDPLPLPEPAVTPTPEPAPYVPPYVPPAPVPAPVFTPPPVVPPVAPAASGGGGTLLLLGLAIAAYFLFIRKK